MKEIVESYGEFFLEAIVIGLLFANVIYGLKDNQGVFQIVGEKIAIANMDYTTYLDFRNVYMEECNKGMPEIYFLGEHLKVGTNKLSDYLAAYDYAGRELKIVINRILDLNGNELLNRYDSISGDIFFTEAGVYLMEMEIRDSDNRIKYYKIQIPVCA